MPTFDIVSEANVQEVRNAVDQAMREVVNRYDFKGTDTKVTFDGDQIVIESDSEGRVEAAIDVLKTKLVRRDVSLKSLGGGEPKEVGGQRVRSEFSLNQGIPQDSAKELVKHIKDQKLKVQAAIQGDQLRITGKKRDDLQEVIQSVRDLDYRIPLQFTNFRD